VRKFSSIIQYLPAGADAQCLEDWTENVYPRQLKAGVPLVVGFLGNAADGYCEINVLMG